MLPLLRQNGDLGQDDGRGGARVRRGERRRSPGPEAFEGGHGMSGKKWRTAGRRRRCL